MSDAKINHELLAAATAEMERFNVAVILQMDAVQVFMLCSMLQLGLRHPSVQPGSPVPDTARKFIQEFAEGLPPDCPAMRKLLAMGDDPHFDLREKL